MFVKAVRPMEGPGPSEALVRIETKDGREEVIVDVSLITDGALDVGPVLVRRDEHGLIELPREAMSGRMRVWISESQFADASEVA